MRPRPLLALCAAGLLAGCAATPSDAPGFAQSFAGVWTVIHAWPAGEVIGSPAPQGHTVILNPSSASDPLGRRCAAPVYAVAPGRVTVALGIETYAPDEGLILDVTCEGRSFARYVAHKGGLLSAAEGWLFELQAASAVLADRRQAAMAAPTAVPQPMPAAAPKPAAKPAPAKPQPAKSAASGDVYLASYRSQESAQAGWAVLQRQAPVLRDLQPRFQAIDLGAKGRFVRLYATGGGADAICAAVKALSPDCGARY